MGRYVIRKLALAVPIVIGTATLIFFLLQIIPGDIAQVMLGEDSTAISQERLQAVREELGLDRPVTVQYLDWLRGVLVLDLGSSFWTSQPILPEVIDRLPYTVSIVVMSIAFSVIVAIPLGVLSALRRNRPTDIAIRGFNSFGYAIPSFFLGILMVLAMGNLFDWYPPLRYPSPLEAPLLALPPLILPALAVGYRQIASISQMVRTSLLEVMSTQYMTTARSKGLSRVRIVVVHGLRSGILPVVTLTGLELVVLFSSTVVIERVFNVPGLGTYIVEAALRRDIPVVQAVVMVFIVLVVVTNLLIDFFYGAVDPRVRHR